MKARATYIAATVFLMAAGGAVQTLFGQNTVPTLNGHQFVPSETIGGPFTETYLLSQLGIGTATSAEYPLFEFEGDTVFAPRGSQLFAVVRFDYQQRIKSWLAARLSFTTIGRLGTNTISLLSAGVTASTTLQFEWKIALLRTESSALALDLGFRNQSNTYVDIYRYVTGIIDRDNVKLVESIPSARALAALRFSHGFNPIVGITGSGTVLVGSDVQSFESGPKFDVEYGAGVSVSGDAALGIPVNALLSFAYYSASLDRNEVNQGSRSIELKFVYSRPRDFVFGPSIQFLSAPVGEEARLSFLNVTVSSRYYF